MTDVTPRGSQEHQGQEEEKEEEGGAGWVVGTWANMCIFLGGTCAGGRIRSQRGWLRIQGLMFAWPPPAGRLRLRKQSRCLSPAFGAAASGLRE